MACRWSDAPTKSANFAHVRRQEGPYSLPPRAGAPCTGKAARRAESRVSLLTVLKELRQLVLDSVEHGARRAERSAALLLR